MIITCPDCKTSYRYDERRFDGAASKRVKCSDCGLVFEVANPTFEPADDSDVGTDVVSELPSIPDEPSSVPPEPITKPEPEPVPVPVASEPVPERKRGAAPPPPPASAAAAPIPGPEPMDPIAPLPRDARFSLAVIAGAQAGSVFQITKPRTFLGRGSAMDIQLRDTEVSRRHAVLEIRDPKVLLIDLGATNGTWYNGARISDAEINHQDEFTLGSTTLMLIVTPIAGPA